MKKPPPSLGTPPPPASPSAAFVTSVCLHEAPAPAHDLPSGFEAGWRDLLEAATDWALVVDSTGRLAFANRAFREALGEGLGDFAGRNLLEFIPTEEQAASRNWLAAAPAPAALTLSLLARDGGVISAATIATTPLGDSRVVLLRPLLPAPPPARVETAPSEREELFRLLTRHAPIGIYRTDPAGRITYANELWQRLAGLWQALPSEGLWWQMALPEDRAAVASRWTAALHQGSEFSAEFRVSAEGTGPRWVRSRLVPAQLDATGATGWIGITEDITAHRQTQDSLLQAKAELEAQVSRSTAELAATNDELSQFAYAVTHDLKAPLRGIQQLSEWLSQDHARELGADGLELVGLLSQRVRRLQRLVDGLLACAQVGRAREEEAEVAMNEVAQRVIRLLNPPVCVHLKIADDLPVVQGNADRLQQVLQHLLDNAIRYQDKPKGQVALVACRVPDAWQFSVADNGPGIPPQSQDRAFQIFQRLQGDDGPAGSGLGLALVKRIVEHRGGRVWLESEVGVGSTFHFTWPDDPPAGRE